MKFAVTNSRQIKPRRSIIKRGRVGWFGWRFWSGAKWTGSMEGGGGREGVEKGKSRGGRGWRRGRVGEGLLTLKIGQKEQEIKQTNRIVYLLKNKQKQDKTKQTKKQKTETKANHKKDSRS